MSKTRVVVVDDSALARSLLKEIIDRQDDMQCVGVASDPIVARETIRNTNPDVITLDVEMPRMDGIDFLGTLMRLRPTPVVMVSTLTERGADVTLRALELGAVDFVANPKIGLADGMRQLADDITDKIRIASKSQVKRAAPASATGGATASTPAELPIGRLSTEKLIFIGASTGGTEATKEVLLGLPPDSPAVLITQHMPPGFTTSYAKRLDGLVRIRVKEAVDGERVLPGHAYLAPDGFHLSVERSGANYIARVRDGEPVNRHKPSVEILFESAARGWAQRFRHHAHRHGRRRRRCDARGRRLQPVPGRGQLRRLRHAARSDRDGRSQRSTAVDAHRDRSARAHPLDRRGNDQPRLGA